MSFEVVFEPPVHTRVGPSLLVRSFLPVTVRLVKKEEDVPSSLSEEYQEIQNQLNVHSDVFTAHMQKYTGVVFRRKTSAFITCDTSNTLDFHRDVTPKNLGANIRVVVALMSEPAKATMMSLSSADAWDGTTLACSGQPREVLQFEDVRARDAAYFDARTCHSIPVFSNMVRSTAVFEFFVQGDSAPEAETAAVEAWNEKHKRT